MEPVVITGIGVVSPLGDSVAALTRRFAEPPQGQAEERAACVGAFPMVAVPADKHIRIDRLDRLCRFFLAAAYLAADDARLVIAPEEADRVGLAFGTGLGCLLTDAEYNRKVVEQGPSAASPRLFAYTVSSAAAGQVSIALGIKGPNVTIHMGLAAGLGAVGYGYDLIQMGKADVVLAGGGDVIGPALLEALRAMVLLKGREQARPFLDTVPGVYPDEAAVVVVLEREDRALRRGVSCWGRIAAYAAGFEPTLTAPDRQSTGVTNTLDRALAMSGQQPRDCGAVLCSAHGTPVDETERAALVEVFGRAGTQLMVAPKAVTGECFGASGVLALAIAAGLWRYSPCLRDDVSFELSGTPVAGGDARRRLAATPLVLINALCYSGTVVSLAFARGA
jgi:3-oxoacyl-[acyl-carrier-protein] synthase II